MTWLSSVEEARPRYSSIKAFGQTPYSSLQRDSAAQDLGIVRASRQHLEKCMPTYQELSAQIASLMQQAEPQRKAEVATVIRDIRAKMAEFGITAADLNVGGASRGSRRGQTVAVKYRNAATGETWTGRGKVPRWLAAEVAKGRTKDQFAV